jgi:hypothetical protein
MRSKALEKVLFQLAARSKRAAKFVARQKSAILHPFAALSLRLLAKPAQ